MKPGVAIDALKQDIRDVEKTMKQIVYEIKDAEEFLVKTKVQISNTGEKAERAMCDRQELYRDLSTFEFNFSKRKKGLLFDRTEEMESRVTALTVELCKF